MADSKPAIYICPGGWHQSTSYSKLKLVLQEAGFEVHVPDLPSMEQVRPPTAGLPEDAALVRRQVEALAESGKTIVMLLHSYGGQVATQGLQGLGQITRATQGLAGGVTHMIYYGAHLCDEGESVMTMVQKFGHEKYMPVAFDFAEDMTVVQRDPKTLMIGEAAELMDQEELQENLATLIRWNGQSMYQSLQGRPAWKDIPSTYVYTNADLTTPVLYQQAHVDRCRASGVQIATCELAAGHCPHVTATQDLATIVQMVARGETLPPAFGQQRKQDLDELTSAIEGVGAAASAPTAS